MLHSGNTQPAVTRLQQLFSVVHLLKKRCATRGGVMQHYRIKSTRLLYQTASKHARFFSLLKMSSTGLFLVSNVKKCAQTLKSLEKYVKQLYIQFNIPADVDGNGSPIAQQPPPVWGKMISQLYIDSYSLAPTIDLRILVDPLKCNAPAGLLAQHKRIDMLFSDSDSPEICEKLRAYLNIPSATIYLQEDGNTSADAINEHSDSKDALQIYNTVVLGGTFDRIHLGHKIFLTQAVLRAYKRLVVGVTEENMLKTKTLPELILPVETRIRDIQEFLKSIDGTLEYDVVPISDPFGPTQSDPDMDMIVVSAETLRGGHKVNELRSVNGLRPLDIYSIDLVESSVPDGPKESKVSSGNTRIDMLGTRLKPAEPKPHLPLQPYIVGLTGGIGSGKSKMAQRFAAKGAHVIDCDKVAHEVYAPGTSCYGRLVQHFGSSIVAADGCIDRKKLGAVVFGNARELAKLNSMVWPEIMKEVNKRIAKLRAEGKVKVVVVEAAVLFAAKWEENFHEVWSMIVAPEEAVKRVIERNAMSEEAARRRLSSQLDNREIVARSNVVFSSQWSHEYTQQQADRAWDMLMQELEQKCVKKL